MSVVFLGFAAPDGFCFPNDDLEKSFFDKSLYLLADVSQGVTGVVICPPLG